MKFDLVVSSTFVVIVSIALHGCDFGPAMGGPDAPALPPAPPPPAVTGARPGHRHHPRKAVCQCGQSLGCQGGGSWCDRMGKLCGKCKKNCDPQCKWSCESPKCAQTCGPKCKSPRCSVRCRSLESSGAFQSLSKQCRMECGKPNCRVVCPQKPCSARSCPKCKTECAKPVCKMACSNTGGALDGCRNVCSQPQCKWECKKPSVCPKPKCSMKCEKPQDCMSDMLGGQTPPLEPGETEVAVVDVPTGPSPAPGPSAAFLQLGDHPSSFVTNFTSMASDRTLHSGQVTLAMVQVETADSVATSWVREQREESGNLVEIMASCTNGKFSCQADAAWCAEQQELICSRKQGLWKRAQRQSQLRT